MKNSRSLTLAIAALATAGLGLKADQQVTSKGMTSAVDHNAQPANDSNSPLSQSGSFSLCGYGVPQSTVEYGLKVNPQSADSTSPSNSVVRSSYDPKSQTSELTVGSDYRVTNTYDNHGRLTSMNTPLGTIQYSYRDDVGEATRTLPNQVTTTWKRDALGHLIEISHSRAGVGALANYCYTYNEFGLLTNIRETTSGSEDVKNLAYDALGRLIQSGSAGFGYDGAGNRVSASTPNGVRHRFAFDWTSHLTNVDGSVVKHDENGNIVEWSMQGVVRQYRYWPDGRLAQARVGNQIAKYGYDSAGHLVSRRSASGTTSYVVDPSTTSWHPLVIKESNGSQTKVLWDGENPLALIHGSTAEWLLGDRVDSVRLVTDSNGILTHQNQYDPFGVSLSAGISADAKLGFFGHLEDPIAGGTLVNGRLYVPQLGVFLQPDSIKQASTPSTEKRSLL